MKPVAILQHDRAQQPGYLIDFLDSRDLPHRVLLTSEGDAVPRRAPDWSGVIVLGSPHSVHDALPWIRDEHRFVQDAFARDVPVLGHCFGGQLMARCLGASVGPCPWPNIGFSSVAATAMDHPYRRVPAFAAFHWHRETFGIPRGARRAFFGRRVLNEGFVLRRHLALQSHLEVTEATVRGWCDQDREELVGAVGPWVQGEVEILAGLANKITALHRAAQPIYAAWAEGIDRPRRIASRPAPAVAFGAAR
jgi:GMP synthase (glutamine-hydrolysing)